MTGISSPARAAKKSGSLVEARAQHPFGPANLRRSLRHRSVYADITLRYYGAKNQQPAEIGRSIRTFRKNATTALHDFQANRAVLYDDHVLPNRDRFRASAGTGGSCGGNEGPSLDPVPGNGVD